MARYIDADKLIEHINNMPWKMDSASEITKFIFLSTVEEAPTTDVVPKSEVEQIFEEIDTTIIAEIDLSNAVLTELECAEELYNRTKGEVWALCKIQDFIAELKKQYTEGRYEQNIGN